MEKEYEIDIGNEKVDMEKQLNRVAKKYNIGAKKLKQIKIKYLGSISKGPIDSKELSKKKVKAIGVDNQNLNEIINNFKEELDDEKLQVAFVGALNEVINRPRHGDE